MRDTNAFSLDTELLNKGKGRGRGEGEEEGDRREEGRVEKPRKRG